MDYIGGCTDSVLESLQQAMSLVGFFNLGDKAVIPGEEHIDYSAYLKRGERVATLLKEKGSREFKENIVLKAAAAYLNGAGKKYCNWQGMSARVGKAVFKLVADKLVLFGEGFDISALTDMIHPALLTHFRFRECEGDEAGIGAVKLKVKEERLFSVDFLDGEGRTYVLSPDKATPSSMVGKSWRWRRRGAQYIYIGCAHMLFGLLCIMSELLRHLDKLSADGSELLEDCVYRALKEKEDSDIRRVFKCNNEEYVVLEDTEHNYPFGAYLREQGIETVFRGTNEYLKCGAAGKRTEVLSSINCPLYVAQHNAYQFKNFWSLNNHNAFESAIVALVKQYVSVVDTEHMRRQQCSEYATVYMTKKNIPQKTVAAMEKSKFNEHFGYVEFDEDVDLKLVKEIENDFFALQTIFKQDKFVDHDIRIRKLGRHRAAGLYFPYLKCMCVDLRYPSSTAHEYLHLLDYHYGELSMKYSFSKVLDRYCLLIGASETAQAKKGKYDLKYYQTPTEVFARCGEMYLVRHLGVDNSLVKPDEGLGFAYPDDEELNVLIKEYFDSFIEKYCRKEEKAD